MSNKSGRYLNKLELKYSRCMAVIGSGTYELRGIPDQQIPVLRSVLLDAKDKGADWELIYSAIYELWAPQRPLLPLPEEMAVQISYIEPASKHSTKGYVEEFKKGYEEGRGDTQSEIAFVKSGQGMSHEYSYKIACQTMFFLFPYWIGSIYLFLDIRAH